MKRFCLGLMAIFVLISLLSMTSPVLAQDTTPTAEPTPAYISEIEIEPGVTFLVERQISYGEMAIVAALLLVLVAFLIYSFVVVVSRLVRN